MDVMSGNLSHDDISYQASWRNQKTAEQYKKAPLVAQSPKQIEESRPECKQIYSKKHLKWLTQVVVMTQGEKNSHPFTKALSRWAPDFVSECKEDIPETYPHPRAIQAMKIRYDSVKSNAIIERKLALRKEVENWEEEAKRTAKILRMAALKNRAFARRAFLRSEAEKNRIKLNKANKEKSLKPSVSTQTLQEPSELSQDLRQALAHLQTSVEIQTDSEYKRSISHEVAAQCPDKEVQFLTPEMLADETFLQKAVELYQRHMKEKDSNTCAHPLVPGYANNPPPSSITDKTPVVKTGYAISKVEGIQVNIVGGRAKYKDDRCKSVITNQWITKEAADAEKASGNFPYRKRISKGNSDLSRIREKIMQRISEKYRCNRRAVYARANLNKKLKKSAEGQQRKVKTEPAFQKTAMHKKIIDYFKFTVAALGDKGLPPEFDCVNHEDENSQEYYEAVIKSYKGEIIQPELSDSRSDSDGNLSQ